jgi:hypothetical protein
MKLQLKTSAGFVGVYYSHDEPKNTSSPPPFAFLIGRSTCGTERRSNKNISRVRRASSPRTTNKK